jgi:hypothetical protein
MNWLGDKAKTTHGERGEFWTGTTNEKGLAKEERRNREMETGKWMRGRECGDDDEG